MDDEALDGFFKGLQRYAEAGTLLSWMAEQMIGEPFAHNDWLLQAAQEWSMLKRHGPHPGGDDP